MGSAPRIGAAPANPAPDPLPPSYVAELSVDHLSGGTISGAVIEVGDDGVIKAGLGSTTVELVKEGLYGYIDGVEVFHLADGELFVKGTIEADDGYFAGELNGAHIFGSTIDASTFTGGTIAIGTGDAVFRASNLGIQLGSGDWLTAPFKVDTTGRLTAKNATVTGTIQTAESGGRVSIYQGVVSGYQTGKIEMWSGLTGETTPASIIQQRINGTSYGNQLAISAGYDPVLGRAGGQLMLRSETSASGGYPISVAAISADQTTVSGTLSVNHKFEELPLMGPAADQWNFDLNYPNPGTPGPGYARIWRDPTGTMYVQGSAKATQAWVNGTVIANLPSGYGALYFNRFIRGYVNGVTPVEIEVTQQTSTAQAQLICRGSVAVNSRVELDGFWPAVEAP